MLNNKDTVIAFDMDGVLIDSQKSIFNALNSALEIFDVPKLDGSQIELIGLPLIEMLNNASKKQLSAEQLQTAIQKYRQVNNKNGPKEAKPYTNIPKVLELLAQRLNLVVVTSKLQSAAIDLLQALELDKYFIGIFGAQEDGKMESKSVTLSRAKSSLDSVLGFETKFLALIGDRSSDITAAHEFKIKAVGALWGYGTESELASADIKLSRPINLLTVF
jgi:phosphoglycolate phosphatase